LTAVLPLTLHIRAWFTARNGTSKLLAESGVVQTQAAEKQLASIKLSVLLGWM